MSPDLMNALPFIVAGLVLLALAVWLLMRTNRTTDVIREDGAPRDVLDEGAAPARRNQALIDAAPAVANNFGATSASANADPVAAAPAMADAEAGAQVEPATRAPAEAAPPTPAPADADAPADAPKPTPKLVSDGEVMDDLSRIKGIGPKLVALLREEGITTFAQIAAWNDAEIERIDAKLGRFAGRIARDQWVEQAKLLISDDKAAYAEKFGNQA